MNRIHRCVIGKQAYEVSDCLSLEAHHCSQGSPTFCYTSMKVLAMHRKDHGHYTRLIPESHKRD